MDAIYDKYGKPSELSKRYNQEREMARVPVKLSNGRTLHLSPGKHNIVQAAVVEEFASRFAVGARLIYLGDTEKKNLYMNKKLLKELGAPIDEHGKLPDVILFDPERNWLFLIEAVTSHGPVTPKRIIELNEMFEKCYAGKIFVSAFPDFAEFKKHTSAIAWDTEVWIMDFPEHLIHFNGDRFIGPR